MPAPTYRLTQTIPVCPDAAPSEIDGTDLDRGNVLVNEDCCRRYGTRLNIVETTIRGLETIRTLFLEEDVPTCSQTAAGAKVFSSDAYQLCNGATGKQWTISFQADSVPCEFGAPPTLWQEAVMEFTLTGGAFPGVVSVGPFSVTSNAGFEGGVSLVLAALYSLGFSSSQVSVTPVYSAPRKMIIAFSAAAAPTSLTATPGLNFVDNLSADENQQCPLLYSGPASGRVRVDGYMRATWTSCAKGGLVVEVRSAIDDAFIAEYANDSYSMKHGIRTQVGRRKLVGECDHPCLALVSAATVRGLHAVRLCVQPALSQPKCRGSIADVEYTITFPVESHQLLKPLAELIGSGNSTGFNASNGGSSVGESFTLTGTLEWSSIFWGSGVTTGVTLTMTRNALCSFHAIARYKQCLEGGFGYVPVFSCNWIGPGTGGPDPITLTAGTGGTALPPPALSPGLTGGGLMSAIWSVTPAFGDAAHDFCAADLVVPASGKITLDCVASIQNPPSTGVVGSHAFNMRLISDDLFSMPGTITQSGLSYEAS